jgi:signal transduction histidine kinase
MWQIGAGANLVIGVAYLAITLAILVPLVRTGQVLANKLGTATAVIFFTCAVHHGTHFVHMVLPVWGLDEEAGRSLRDAMVPHVVVWDVFGAVVAAYYWSLRSIYGSLMKGAQLFEDMRERQRQALELNDDIVQGLTAASMALALDERERSEEVLAETLASARRIVSDLLGVAGAENRLAAADLVRTQPAGAQGRDPS